MRRWQSLVLVLLTAGPVLAQDMPLSQVLLDGENWRPVAAKFSSIQGLAAAPDGTVYVADSGATDLTRVTPGGEARGLACAEAGLTALACGPDDRLYAAQPGEKRIVVLAEEKGGLVRRGVAGRGLVVAALAVAPRGESPRLYAAVPADRSIYLVDLQSGQARRVARLEAEPSGLVFWPDGGTLVVGTRRGRSLWAFRVEKDGSLADGEAYYPLRGPVAVDGPQVPRPGTRPAACGGLTVDGVGRLYAATGPGVQVFDPTGRLSGVLLRPGGPRQAAPSAVVFGGRNHGMLFIACSNRLFVRKTKVGGDARNK